MSVSNQDKKWAQFSLRPVQVQFLPYLQEGLIPIASGI